MKVVKFIIENKRRKRLMTDNLSSTRECPNGFKITTQKSVHNQSMATHNESIRSSQRHLFDQIKLQENPSQMNKFEAPDVREEEQEHLRKRLERKERKGGRIFRFRDVKDFSSFYDDVEREEREKNMTLFEKQYGDSRMACRSIASQSDYNPKIINEFRRRSKQKQINPPMKYTNKISPSLFIHRKSKSVAQPRTKTQPNRHQQHDCDNMIRRSTSMTNSAFGDQLNKSYNSIKEGSESSEDGQKGLKKLSVTLKNPNNQKIKESGKSYFVGITHVKLNSKDPHFKKTLHNILVKVGKTHSNPRDRALMSNVEVLSNEMN